MAFFSASARASLLLISGIAAGALAFSQNESAGAQYSQLWHKKGFDGLKCVSCHTPRGTEILMSSVTAADMERRAIPHLHEADAKLISDAFRQCRSTKVVRRPFEPAGGILAGTTPEARDEAFGAQLQKLYPSWFVDKSRTYQEALRDAKALTAVPLTSIRTGFEFDELSNDPFRNKTSLTINDWIPDVELSLDEADQFTQIASKFPLSEPIRGLQSQLAEVQGKPKTSFEQLSHLKRLALLEYERSLLTDQKPLPGELSRQFPEDPIWGVGNWARVMNGFTPEILGIPPAKITSLRMQPGQKLNLSGMALSWFWVAWMRDPSLLSTSRDKPALDGQYMSETVWLVGPLAMHNAFFCTRRPIETYFEQRGSMNLKAEFTAFSNDSALEINEPKSPQARKRFLAWCTSLVDVYATLLTHDAQTRSQVWQATQSLQQLEGIYTFLKPRIGSKSSKSLHSKLTKLKTALAPHIKKQLSGG